MGLKFKNLKTKIHSNGLWDIKLSIWHQNPRDEDLFLFFVLEIFVFEGSEMERSYCKCLPLVKSKLNKFR